MAEGFLGRWAKRKEAVRKGEPVPPEPVPQEPAARPAPGQGLPAAGAAPAAVPQPRGAGAQRSAAPAVQGNAAPPPAPPAPPPTLEDVQALTPASDFSRFTRPGVDPVVKNAAMKKLFADPHFNVMDGLDIYIDDYTKSAPIPPAMLRQLASAKFLDLFDEQKDKESDKAPTTREAADAPQGQSVAQSGTAEPAVPPADQHADPDLRLQQDDAPGPRGPGTGSG